MGTNLEIVLMRFNSDTGSNYRVHRLTGNGSAVSSADFGSRTSLVPMAATDTTANAFTTSITDVLDFSQSTKNKTTRSLSGRVDSGYEIQMYSGAWFSTAAVTSINLFASGGNISVGSRFSIYGLKG
jgi:hypothetical protein